MPPLLRDPEGVDRVALWSPTSFPIDNPDNQVQTCRSGEFSGLCVMIQFLRNPEGAPASALRYTDSLEARFCC